MIFDAHCDVLMKLWLNKHLSVKDSSALHVTLKGLEKAGGKVQLFAIYIPEAVPSEHQFDVALEMVQLFHTHILTLPNVKWVKSRRDVANLEEDEIGAMLTLEGCDAIGDNLVRLQTLLSLGVRSVGLTWNYSNALCDGILEPRGAGLSTFGRTVVKENNKRLVWTDVSHLSVKGFWDTIEEAEFVVATHSNAYKLCSNPRNLNDEQIEALIKKNGVIGITFVPQFLSDHNRATIGDVLKHLDYICGKGGEYAVGFGSDFDGIEQTVQGLGSYKEYENLINELVKHYSAAQVDRFLFHNFVNRLH
ncbi:membrane dipeptidase [Priestia megaterium]|nr:membrane dipeptidase [Priestia megaterium]